MRRRPGTIRWLRNRPLSGVGLPEEVRRFPSMLYESERALLYVLGRRFSGFGQIVDAGCFLGGSTFALAAGLAAGGCDPASWAGVIHAYDLFRLDELTKAEHPDLVPGIGPGEALRPRFEQLLGPSLGFVDVHEGDIRESHWDGAPIEILFLDACKSWDINDHVVREFFPALVPGRSVVIHEDFVHEWLPFIPVTMGLLADAFEFVAHVPPSVAVFVPTAPLTAANIPERLRELPDQVKLACFDRACAPFTGEEKAILECARAMLLLDMARHADAGAALDAIRPESSERVARSLATTRSWLKRSDPDPAVAGPAWERWHEQTGA
jgi:hypothetical protein